MIPPDFSRIVYKFPKLKAKGEPITNLLGLDSEAYSTGEPFMFALSDGTVFLPGQNPGFLLDHYPGRHFTTYNLKYDAGAMIYHIPNECKIQLWQEGKTEIDGITIKYIPSKMLSFSRSRAEKIMIWDISQYFYRMRLDTAARRYLNEKKLDVSTKTFTPEYVKRHWKLLCRYCIHDAKLCADLSNYFVAKLKEFGVRTTALYSSASLSFRYFADNGKIVTSWHYWKYHQPLIRYALEAYQGGKFEVTARGTFAHGYEYDLVSAYPCEIANLVDITTARILESRRYQKDAVYGYLRVHLKNPAKHIPCGPANQGVCQFPAGEMYLTITKAEYEYLAFDLNLDISIINAYWIFVKNIAYPYRERVDTLFKLKALYKGKDESLCDVAKKMLNSYYGKMHQMIPDFSGSITCGQGWNPMYSSVITANVRLKVTRIQNMLKADCLAVHTDSVITLRPLPADLVTSTLGNFSPVTQGPGTLIACGMYAIGEYQKVNTEHGPQWSHYLTGEVSGPQPDRERKQAYKGFNPRKGDNWLAILKRYKNRKSFTYPVLKVISWRDAVARGNFDKINFFHRTRKEILFNGDQKRTWQREVRGRDLLGEIEQSTHLIIKHNSKPEYWR